MKTITATELNNCLASHKLWVETNGKQGQRANLVGANLSYSNLYGACLEGANLENANLYGANLVGANLSYSNLTGANLKWANLEGANLIGTILEKKVEKQPEASPCKVENTRQDLEKLAKEHGFKIVSLGLELL